jgi:PAS domain S-box-containing protein
MRGFYLTSLLLISIFFVSCGKQLVEAPVAENGVLDLTSWNFEKNGKIELNGQWKFYWNKFYNFSDFQNPELIPDTLLSVPSVWNSVKKNNSNLPAFGFATYRLTLKTAPSLAEISLSVPFQAAAYDLFLNNKKIANSGIPATTKELYVPSRLSSTAHLKLDTTVNELILHVSNFDYSKGGMWRSIDIGTERQIDTYNKLIYYSDNFATGVLFIIMFFSFVLYYFQRKNLASLYFSIFCFSIFLRNLFTNGVIVENFFPDFPYRIALRIEFLTFTALTISFNLFLIHIYPKARVKLFDYISIGSASVYSLVILFTSTYFFTNTLVFYQVIFLLSAIYAFMVIIRAILLKYPSAKYIFIGFLFIFFAAFFDIFIDRLIVHLNFYISSYAVVIFIFFQSIGLIVNLIKVEKDKAMLEGNLKTINQLNENGLEIIANLKVEEILDVIFEKVNLLAPIHNLELGIYNSDKKVLQFTGKNEQKIIMQSEIHLDDPESLTAVSFMKREKIFISDFSSEYKKYVPKFNIAQKVALHQSHIYIPLVAKNTTIGVLSVQHKLTNAFAEIDYRTIQNIALFASVAIDNARAYEIINANERQLFAILDTASEGIAMINIQGNFTFVNNAACQISGYEMDELLKINYFDFFADDKEEAFSLFMQLIFGEVETVTSENQYYRKDGSKIWCRVSGKCIRNSQGEAEQIVGIITNIDDIKKNELKLKEMIADKDRFISILAHDLRSPFTTILGFLELLSFNVRNYDIEQIESEINLINNSAQTVFNLLDDILLWGSSHSGKLPFNPQTFNFAEVVLRIISDLQPIADSKSIKIGYSGETKISVFADQNMLKTVVRNLISNAIKFTFEEGEINVSLTSDQGKVSCSVSDNGMGMSSENVSKLFDIAQTFTSEGTANEKGTGLGLLLCKEFVEKHGGEIWVESMLGEGSDFTFVLPVNVS